MNLDAIENLLVEKLGTLLRKQTDVLAGPVSTLALGGMQETVFVHAARFEDYDGITPDGASITRRPFRSGRVSGTEEERPCLIVVEVTCIATAYSRVKALSGQITPEFLLAMACEREFELGASDNRQCSLRFTDLRTCLHQAETIRQEDEQIVFHLGRMVFHINGALHLRLSKYGGLKAKRPSLEKPVVRAGDQSVGKSMKKPKSVKPRKMSKRVIRK